MTVFRVWAPTAHTVEVALGDARDGAVERVPMRAGARGWWEADVPQVGPGMDYRFALNGGEPAPDPRSPWQPDGVFGPSRVVDHAAFAWSDAGYQSPPLAAAILYEVHIGTFTPEGTYTAAIGRLDHLVRLGVTHVELMPAHQFPGSRGWGYDGVDLFAPQASYGGPEGLKTLVDACHRRGLGVVMDVVYNHLGPSGNYLGQFGPYFTERYTTPWGAAVNLDGPGSDEVRRFLLDNALMWLRDYHCDGLRLDAVHALLDSSATHILEQVSREVEGLAAATGRHLFVIAESALNDPQLVRSREAGGYGLDAQWSDDFHHALHTVLTGERDGYYVDFGRLTDLADALEHAFVYDGRYSPFLDRVHGRPIGNVPGYRFLGYAQNHDQIGNRARGERSSALLSTDQLKIAAALVLTAPFTPMLFQGEEWGATTPFQYFTDHQDPELARAVSRGRREEFIAFGWDPDDVPDPQDPATFERSTLNWDEARREPHASLLSWYRQLIRLRKSTPSLVDGRLDRVHVDVDEEARWLVLERGSIAVACNFADERREAPLRPAPRRILLASAGGVELSGDRVTLPPAAVVILDDAVL